MHDIWNPWHGCRKISEGCDNCYMFYQDRIRGKQGDHIFRTQAGFTYPLQTDRQGRYKIKSGETIRVCMTSDFFLEEADVWRAEAWAIMRQRSDVLFFLLTKRPQRVLSCLPPDWGDGWENIFFNVSCENQQRAHERIPLLRELPFRHKGIMCAPLIGEIRIEDALADGGIEQVICGGENYEGSRPCHFEWVKSLSEQCLRHDVSFYFIETGTSFFKGGRPFWLKNKQTQSEMAWKSGLSHTGRPITFDLSGAQLALSSFLDIHVPRYKEKCKTCGSRWICNGCSDCGRCAGRLLEQSEMKAWDMEQSKGGTPG